MSISLLYRGYFPLSFTNSDIICCFIADLASYRQARQFYNLLSSHLSSQTLRESRPCQTGRFGNFSEKYHSVAGGPPGDIKSITIGVLPPGSVVGHHLVGTLPIIASLATQIFV